MKVKHALPIFVVIVLVAVLVVPAVLWLFVPKVEDVRGLLAFDQSDWRWILMTPKGQVLHYYQIQDPEPLLQWVDCDKCHYSADLRLKILSKKSGEMHGSEVVGHETEIVHVWNIRRNIFEPECFHKK